MNSVTKDKWEPAVPVKPTNSLHTYSKYEIPFLPSYEKGNPSMYALMCMEYRRLWFKERGLWEKKVYQQSDKSKQAQPGLPTQPTQILQRSYVKRKSKNKRSPAADFKMKRFRKVPARTDNRDPSKNERMKRSNKKDEGN